MTVNRNIPVEFTVKNTYEVADTRFIEVSIKLMHTDENYNGSYFSKDVVESAIPSLANTPILAYIEENSNGEIDYSDHRQVLVEEDGQCKIKYLGQAIGVIPETNNARFEKYTTKSNVEREYLVVDGLLWTKWDDPIDIIQRDGIHQQSMEIHRNYQGRFEKDNLFHFTYFQFFGACALSNINILPAMEEASIELKFSMEDFKQEIQEKMEQFKHFNSQNQSSTLEVDNIKFQKKEDNFVDEKLELLKKYNLTTENISFSIEELSLEEIDSKIKEHFALLASQKQEEIANCLAVEKFMDRWGDEYRKYSYVDHNETEVFAYDRQDNWNLYGFMYSMNEDSVVIDFSTKKRKKFEIVDFVEGETVFSLFPQEAIDYAITDNTKETENKFTSVNAEIEQLKIKISEYEAKDGEFELIKSDFEKVKTEKETLEKAFVILKEENNTLKEFKLERETLAKEEIFAKFDGLTEEEVADIKEHISDYSVETLEEKLFAIWGKKKMELELGKTFSKKKVDKKDKLVFSIVDGNTQDLDAPIYVDIINKHKK